MQHSDINAAMAGRRRLLKSFLAVPAVAAAGAVARSAQAAMPPAGGPLRPQRRLRGPYADPEAVRIGLGALADASLKPLYACAMDTGDGKVMMKFQNAANGLRWMATPGLHGCHDPLMMVGLSPQCRTMGPEYAEDPEVVSMQMVVSVLDVRPEALTVLAAYLGPPFAGWTMTLKPGSGDAFPSKLTGSCA